METTQNWQTALQASYEQLLAYLVTYAPKIFGALLLIVVGFVVAWLLSRLTLSMIRVLSRLWRRMSARIFAHPVKEIRASHALIISRSVFWLVMLFFFAAATSNLGLNFFATWLTELLSYVPRLLAGLVIIIGGYLLGSVVSAMAQAAAESAGIRRPRMIAEITKLAVIFTALVVGIEQLGINLQFVTTLVIVMVGVLTMGVALAFGLGSKHLVANLVATRQVRNHFKINERIKIGEWEGVLIQITATMVIIETENGRTVIPAKTCLEQSTRVELARSSTAVKDNESQGQE